MRDCTHNHPRACVIDNMGEYASLEAKDPQIGSSLLKNLAHYHKIIIEMLKAFHQHLQFLDRS